MVVNREKKMKRILILLLLIIILSGCSAKYELSYKNSLFDEKLTINNYKIDRDLEFLIDHYKNDNIYSDINDKVITDKRITSKGGNKYNLEFMASYDEEPYSNSLAISSCFEYNKYEENNDTIYIALYGEYYCDTFDELKVVFNTDKKINYSNAHDESFSKLIWNFEPEDEIEIELEISKNENKFPGYVVLILLIGTVIIGLLSYLIYKFYVIYKKNKEV